MSIGNQHTRGPRFWLGHGVSLGDALHFKGNPLAKASGKRLDRTPQVFPEKTLKRRPLVHHTGTSQQRHRRPPCCVFPAVKCHLTGPPAWPGCSRFLLRRLLHRLAFSREWTFPESDAHLMHTSPQGSTTSASPSGPARQAPLSVLIVHAVLHPPGIGPGGCRCVGKSGQQSAVSVQLKTHNAIA